MPSSKRECHEAGFVDFGFSSDTENEKRYIKPDSAILYPGAPAGDPTRVERLCGLRLDTKVSAGDNTLNAFESSRVAKCEVVAKIHDKIPLTTPRQLDLRDYGNGSGGKQRTFILIRMHEIL